MNFSREFNKFLEDTYRKGTKLLNKSKLQDILQDDIMEYLIQYIRANNKESAFVLLSANNYKRIRRDIITDTLKESNYKKTESKWEPPIIVSFMNEVMTMDLYEWKNSELGEYRETLNRWKQEISERYNVPVHRLKPQMNLFLLNLHKGNDKANIYSYFSPYEIMNYKYRYGDNMDKLNEDIEQGKLNEIELNIVKQYYGV